MKHPRHTQDLIALIRIRPPEGRRIYLFSIVMAATLSVFSFIQFLTLVQYGLQAFVIYPYLLSPKSLELYLFGALLLVASYLYLVVQAGHYLHELRGLWWFFHTTETTKAKKISWNSFLKVSSPLWLAIEEILPDPSPTTALEKILGSVLTIEEAQSLYQASIERQQQEATSTLSIKISLANTISISIIGEDGKQETFDLPRGNNRPALIAFLALHPSGEWIPKDILLKQVYGSTTKGGLFLKDIERLQKEINEHLQQAGLLDPTIAEEVKLFEHQAQGNTSYWRLSLLCEIDGCSELNALYQNILALGEEETASKNIPPSREELHNACHNLMTGIGKGFLSEYQEQEMLWPWIEERYLTYRHKCLTVLEYAAKTEVSRTQDQSSPEIQVEAMSYAAKYYRWMVLVSCESIPDLLRGRETLLCCLKLYRLLKNSTSAKSIFRTYAQKMRSLENAWIPDRYLLEIWPEVIPPLWKKIQQEPHDEQEE